MTAAPSRRVDLPAGRWYRIETGRAVVRLAPPAGPTAGAAARDEPDAVRPADLPAVAVVGPGDLVLPATGRSLRLEAIGGRLPRVTPIDPAGPAPGPAASHPDPPAVARWIEQLSAAAGRGAGNERPAAVPDTSPDPVRTQARTDALLAEIEQAVAARVRRRRAGRRPRPPGASGPSGSAPAGSSATPDAGAIDLVTAAVPRLRRRRPTAPTDPAGFVIARLGGTVGGTDSPAREFLHDDVAAAGPDDVLQQLIDRAARAGLLMDRIPLDRDCRHTLARPVAAVRLGHPVVVEPAAGGARLLDPVEGLRRRLTRRDLADLAPVAAVALVELPAQGDARSTWRALLRLSIRGLRVDLLALIGLVLVSGGLSLLLPVASGAIFATIVPGDQSARLAALVIAMALVVLSGMVLTLLVGRVTARVRTRVDAAAGDAVWARLMRAPAAFFGRHGRGELLTRAGAVDSLRQIVADATVSSLSAVVAGLAGLGVIMWQSGAAGLLVLGIVTLQAIVFALVVRTWTPLLGRQSVEQQSYADATLQAMRGMSRIRAFGAESAILEQIATRYAAWAATAYRSATTGSVLTVAGSVWGAVGTMAIAAGFAVSGAQGPSSAGYVVLATALGQVLGATGTLTTVAGQLVTVRPTLRQLDPILAAAPEAAGPASGVRTGLRGDIDVSGVTFRYDPDGPDVLHEVSLSVRAGEFVAVVGASGSGKSTLLRLLLGFEQPVRGTVAYDGIDLGRRDLRATRRQIGTVLQRAALFPGSLAENIRGPRPLTQAQIWAAAEAASVADDIRAMPMGLQTVMVEGAGSVSGGQRQRILLARALAGHPAVLLLDEATSALDNRTQAQVTAALDRLRVTRVAIAHRLSTVRHADRIVVLDRGRVVQQGTYGELIAAPGVFADLAARQMLVDP